MSAMRVFHTVTITAAVILLIVGALVSSWIGPAAAALGMVGTAVYLWGTWLVVRLAGESSKAGASARNQAIFTAFALLMKLPVIYAGWMVAGMLGPLGPTWFLLGLALVYCAVVWRAVLASRD